jgi:peptidoglycan pentaglycine glycine transferase (the first glycine)
MIEPGWNEQIKALPNSHVLQSTQWADVKKEVGWESNQLHWNNDCGDLTAAAMILTRTVRVFRFGPGLKVGYIPRGPILDWNDQELTTRVLDKIEQFAVKNRLIFIKIDPEVVLGRGIPGSENAIEVKAGSNYLEILKNRGWQVSPEQIQFKNTVQIDLTGSEEELLKRMKQKTRYNLRLAERSGVVIRAANQSELPDFYAMYAQTAARDGFIIREENYYLRVWQLFMDSDMAIPLVAEIEGQKIAGLILFYFAGRAWYLYGMSTTQHREKMPNYLLQWKAMLTAKAKGCSVYDLWGAPDVFDESDSMFGVFRFKEGLGGEVIRTPGAWDFTRRPLLYSIYHQVLPRILNVTRWVRRGKIQREVK